MKTPKQKEQGRLREIISNKSGINISIKCWSPTDGSSAETHCTSISNAVKFLKQHEKFYPNWKLELISE